MRFFSVYGPKERAKKQYAKWSLSSFRKCRGGRSSVIFGNGSQTRDFIYVKDVIRALQLAMDSNYHGVLNVGTEKAYSFKDAIGMLNQKLESAVEPMYTEKPIKNYVLHTMVDTSKCSDILKFEAQYIQRGDRQAS